MAKNGKKVIHNVVISDKKHRERTVKEKETVKNLISISSRTKEEQDRMRKNSGKSRSKNNRFYSIIRDFLNEKIDVQGFKDDITRKEAMCLSMIQQSMKGNVRAFEVITTMLGEKPNEEINVNVVNPDNVSMDVIKNINKILDSKEVKD